MSVTAMCSRRQLLSATLVVPIAACTSRPLPARPDPDAAVRAEAVARELRLLEAYDVAGLSAARAAVRSEHALHLIALGGAEPTRSAAPRATAAPMTVAELVGLERAAAAAHAAGAVAATSRSLAVVLASLAASEAAHPVALA